jgi:hypothetical protein
MQVSVEREIRSQRLKRQVMETGIIEVNLRDLYYCAIA